MKLNEDQLHVTTNALLIAAEQFDSHAKEMAVLAAHLRAGKAHGLFAAGEPGARAAERMADQFRRQAKEARELFDAIQERDADDEERGEHHWTRGHEPE